MNGFFSRVFPIVLLLGVLLAACSGGESGTGIGGSHPKVSVGVITGFGSVFVNGVEFDTSNAQIHLNDTQATEQDLAIGMLVAVVGDTDSAQQTGTADTIYYESKVCGLVSQNNQDGFLNILGQRAQYDDETVFDSTVEAIAIINDIPVGAVVEVSGYRTGDNAFHATHIQLLSTQYTPGARLNVTGMATSRVTGGKFTMGDLTVLVDTATEFSGIESQQLEPGMEIKVTSERGLVNGELWADKIQGGASPYNIIGATVEIEGIVTNPDVQVGEFSVNGYTVTFSDGTEFRGGDVSNLDNGVKVEVEGELVSDHQIDASAVVFRTKARFSLIAPVTTIFTAENRVDVSGVIAQISRRTLIKDDDRNTHIKRFSLADLSPGDRVEVKGFQDNLAGEVIATQLRRKEAQSLDTSFEITGVLDELTPDFAVISGIAVHRSGSTPVLTQAQVGTQVTITGTAPVTGP